MLEADEKGIGTKDDLIVTDENIRERIDLEIEKIMALFKKYHERIEGLYW